MREVRQSKSEIEMKRSQTTAKDAERKANETMGRATRSIVIRYEEKG